MEKSISNFKINVYYLLGVLLFFSFVEPAFLERINWVDNIYLIMEIFFMLVMGIIICKKIISGEYKLNKIVFFIILFFLTLLISTIINNQSIISWAKYSIPIILFSLFFDVLKKKQVLHFLNGAVFVFMLLILINFITVVLFPDGLYEGQSKGENYYFLGHNNSVIRIMLPGIVFSAVYDFLCYGKLKNRTYIMVILTMITVTLTWSNSAMIGCGIILIYMLFLKNRKIDIIFNANFMFALICIFFVLVIVMGNVEIILPQIANLFGKDATLTGRTEIWSTALETVKEHLLMGYGYGVSIPQISNWSFDPSSFHNYFLDLIFRGGLVHLALLFVIVKMCCDKISKKHTDLRQFLLFVLLSYFIMWQVLPFTNFDSWGMMLVFIICYKSEWIEESKENMEGENDKIEEMRK